MPAIRPSEIAIGQPDTVFLGRCGIEIVDRSLGLNIAEDRQRAIREERRIREYRICLGDRQLLAHGVIKLVIRRLQAMISEIGRKIGCTSAGQAKDHRCNIHTDVTTADLGIRASRIKEPVTAVQVRKIRDRIQPPQHGVGINAHGSRQGIG
ncbi:MAG: hypothetical protein BWY82_02570 [Verrucomicrobia bacterium ADurb.Bin474]|nr:MAG: hypothetical protein BWY82_02570 [Verrucomicrobia bacterium ADurb.Bin474]